MKKLLLLIFLLPFFASAQFVTGTIQKNTSTGIVRGNFGSSGTTNLLTLASLSATAPISYDNTTGIFSIANGAIANAKLANSSITIGSTSISLGATSTTLAGLTSVTSTTFVGALTGHASLDLALTGGSMSAPIVFTGTTVGSAGTRWIGSDGGTGLTINGATATSISLSLGNGELVNIVPGTVTVKAAFATTGSATITGSSPQLTLNKSGGGSAIIQVNSDSGLQLGNGASPFIVTNSSGLLYGANPHLSTPTSFLAVESTSGNLIGYRTAAELLSDIGAASSSSPFSLAAIGSTANANGATLSSGVFNLQPASTSFGGVVTTGTQSFVGTKTFTGNVNFSLDATFSAGQNATFNGTTTLNGTPTATGSFSINRPADVNAALLAYRTAGALNWYIGTAVSGGPNSDYEITNYQTGSYVTAFKIAYASNAATFASTLGINGVADNIKSSTYTPTLTGITNVASSTASQGGYLRVGNKVFVYGKITLDPTTAATQAIIEMTLPIASDFTVANDASGSGSNNDYGDGAVIYAEPTGNKIRMNVTPTSAANAEYFYTFGYDIK